ncbi:hypothetical protein [Ruminococcus sp. AM43-6]|uniref:hypothetical protein n=1 Tax=Ruminococcus sp. AM43-6 TaxID=2293216 RepID=UPI001FA93DBA|nr:hypothetical protein [Ruminococcus sp. AM43-6]
MKNCAAGDCNLLAAGLASKQIASLDLPAFRPSAVRTNEPVGYLSRRKYSRHLSSVS